MAALKKCYVCEMPSERSHAFYPELCPSCGNLNFEKRNRVAGLCGFTAVVTGGRLKIGFETALKLLRCGATVVITTRFADDARARFLQQGDASDWKDRFHVVAADFRDVSRVESLINWLSGEFATIDILINNAAQTIRRPPAFYRHLLSEPAGKSHFLTDKSKHLLELKKSETALRRLNSENELMSRSPDSDDREIAFLSQVPLMPGDELVDVDDFPEGRFDKDGQQEDRRDVNSWMLKLEDVHLVEFLEVMYINVVAAFLFCSRLRLQMKKRDNETPSFIINVSAMEGNFYDPEKNWRHPHTNMAKAALNMMTRTSASEFREDRIFMNAVDPGWVTNERPFPRGNSELNRRVRMAIDEVDGAARICDPIFRALNDNEVCSGLLFKNYMVHPW